MTVLFLFCAKQYRCNKFNKSDKYNIVLYKKDTCLYQLLCKSESVVRAKKKARREGEPSKNLLVRRSLAAQEGFQRVAALDICKLQSDAVMGVTHDARAHFA